MSGVRLVLGPVGFSDFEVPDRISLGGTQKLAVHELPGGGRVIDVMGAQSADLSWSGVFSGADASDRVRLLDGVRLLGVTVPLSWDVFAYTVIIERLEVEYTSPWWIPYRLVCKVVEDPVADLLASGVTLLGDVVSDLATAAGYFSLGGAQAAVTVSGATTQGSVANIAAVDAVTSGRQGIDAQIGVVGATLGDGDLGDAVSSCGEMAGLGVARSYAGRAASLRAYRGF